MEGFVIERPGGSGGGTGGVEAGGNRGVYQLCLILCVGLLRWTYSNLGSEKKMFQYY